MPRELSVLRKEVLFGWAIRSSKVEGLLDTEALADVELLDFIMPLLTDRDIGALVDVLDKHNRLGVL